MIIQRRLQPERIDWHRQPERPVRRWISALCFHDVLVINHLIEVRRMAQAVYMVYDDRAMRAHKIKYRTSFTPGAKATQAAVARSVEDATALVVKLLDAA